MNCAPRSQTCTTFHYHTASCNSVASTTYYSSSCQAAPIIKFPAFHYVTHSTGRSGAQIGTCAVKCKEFKTMSTNNPDGNDTNNQKAPRRRGLTSLTLEWFAEKFKRANRVKEELQKGTYAVDSEKLAQALLSGGPGRNSP